MTINRILFAWILALCTLAGAPALAQSGFPSKTIKIVIGFPAGVPADVMARIIAPKLAESLGQPVIVENKPGAGSNLAASFVAKSDADGYTLFISSNANAIGQSTSQVNFNLVEDFAPISSVADVPGVLVAHPSIPAKLSEFVAQSKAKPEAYSFGSSGSGSASHLFGVVLNLNAGTKLRHVPYRGSSQTLTDLIAGRIDVFFSPTSTVLEHVKNGSIRALAVLGTKRVDVLPDVPTFAEAGYKGFEDGFWFGLMAPKATPPAVVERLNKEIVRIVALPDVRESLLVQTIVPVSSTSAAFGDFVRRDVDRWRSVADAAGIRSK